MHNDIKASGLAALLVAVLVTGAGAMGAPSVIAMNQKLKSGEVSITYANVPKAGYLVVHPSLANGKPSKSVLGETQLKAGDSRNIKVRLDRNVAAGTKLWAELQPTNDARGAGNPFADFGHPVEQSFKIL